MSERDRGAEGETSRELDASPFQEVYAKAYDWLLDDDGYLWGLIAGDMGYDKSDKKLSDLMEEAREAEWDRFVATGEKVWPVHNAVLQFVRTLVNALPPAPAMEAPAGAETGTGSVGDDSAADAVGAPRRNHNG